MVAVIHSSASLRTALLYNENKVKAGAATFLDAGYYLHNTEALSFHQKLDRLQKRTALNQKVKTNTLHVSLNFSPGEKLPDDKLRAIAKVYLEKIGFTGQPYLLYAHHDAGHPHLHAVTVNIRADGSSIPLHNIGRLRSEPARKQIEAAFELMPAQRQQLQLPGQGRPATVEYGKQGFKQAVSNVLAAVLDKYKYASVAELNAVLSEYNVMADTGSENSRIAANKGLVYRALDKNGNKVGVPLKASSFHHKATLKDLTERFERNRQRRDTDKPAIRNLIDMHLDKKADVTLDSLTAALDKQGVKLLARKSTTGQIYGITYVDHRTKSVFNGSELGKQYSAKAVQERCGSDPETGSKQSQNKGPTSKPGQPDKPIFSVLAPVATSQKEQDDTLFNDLLSPLEDHSGVPWQLRKKRRKSSRRKAT
jgi:hypothetical protein